MIKSLYRNYRKTEHAKDEKMMGVFLPPSWHHYITLVSLQRGISRSSILRDLVNRYIREKEIEGYGTNTIVETINHNLQSEWNTKKILHNYSSKEQNKFFTNFINEAETILKNTDLPNEIVMQIINIKP